MVLDFDPSARELHTIDGSTSARPRWRMLTLAPWVFLQPTRRVAVLEQKIMWSMWSMWSLCHVLTSIIFNYHMSHLSQLERAATKREYNREYPRFWSIPRFFFFSAVFFFPEPARSKWPSLRDPEAAGIAERRSGSSHRRPLLWSFPPVASGDTWSDTFNGSSGWVAWMNKIGLFFCNILQLIITSYNQFHGRNWSSKHKPVNKSHFHWFRQVFFSKLPVPRVHQTFATKIPISFEIKSERNQNINPFTNSI